MSHFKVFFIIYSHAFMLSISIDMNYNICKYRSTKGLSPHVEIRVWACSLKQPRLWLSLPISFLHKLYETWRLWVCMKIAYMIDTIYVTNNIVISAPCIVVCWSAQNIKSPSTCLRRFTSVLILIVPNFRPTLVQLLIFVCPLIFIIWI
jgi:hypothetical protein